MGLWSAICRRWDAFWSGLIFWQTRKAEAAEENPMVMAQNYDNVIAEKRDRLRGYTEAISNMVASNKETALKAKDLNDEIEKLTAAVTNAGAKARKAVDAYRAKHPDATPQQIKEALASNPEYVKDSGAYADFKKKLGDKTDRFKQYEKKVADNQSKIEGHKTNIRQINQEIEDLGGEKHEAISDVMGATEEQKSADAINGLAKDDSAEQLARLRASRRKVVARAETSSELSGLSTGFDVAEYAAGASATAAANEFDVLMGLATAADHPSETKAEVDTALPEN